MKKLFFINTIGLLLFLSSCGNQESSSEYYMQIDYEEAKKIERIESKKEIAIKESLKEIAEKLRNQNISYNKRRDLKKQQGKYKELINRRKERKNIYPPYDGEQEIKSLEKELGIYKGTKLK